MTNIDLVSVIIPAFNTERKILAKSIESALCQTHPRLEIIVVDDNSKFPIRELNIDYILDKRVRVIRNSENLGAAKSRNIAINNSKGRYIAFLDADDTWHPEKLSRQIEFMEATGAQVSNTGYICSDQNENILFSVRPLKKLTWFKLWATTNVGCSTVIIDKASLKSAPIMPLYKNSHDTALWSQLVNSHLFMGLDQPLTNYRIGHASSTSNRWQTISYNFTVFSQECGLILGPLLWAYYVFNAIAKRLGLYNYSEKIISEFW